MANKRCGTKRRPILIMDVSSDSDDDVDTSLFTRTQAPTALRGTARLQKNSSSTNVFSQPIYRLPSGSAGSKSKKFISDSDSWRPIKANDLCIHPKKVKEVKDWIQKAKECCNNRLRGSYLLITGRSGTGKSTTVRVLADSLGMNVVYWENDCNFSVQSGYNTNIVKQDDEYETFKKFLKYGCSSIAEPEKTKLLLVDQVPMSVYSSIKEFHHWLTALMYSNHHVVVFCLSNTGAYEISPDRLFPKHFINSVGIDTITFQPVASTYMKQALQRIISLEKFVRKPSAKDLKSIEDIADGDLNCATNLVKFCQQQGEWDAETLSCLTSPSSDELFHMLGRILYAKRIVSDNQVTNSLAPLERNIDDILEMSRASSDTILGFLHEHEPRFASSLSDLRAVSDAFSLADTIRLTTARYDEDRKRKMDHVQAQMCGRFCMYHNNDPGESHLERNLGRYTFGRPVYRDLDKEIDGLNKELNENIHTMVLGKDVIYLTVPMLAEMRAFVAASQTEVIWYLTRSFKTSWKLGRIAFRNALGSRCMEYQPRTVRTSPTLLSAVPPPQSWVEPTIDCGVDEDMLVDEVIHITDSEDEVDSFDEDIVYTGV